MLCHVPLSCSLIPITEERERDPGPFKIGCLSKCPPYLRHDHRHISTSNPNSKYNEKESPRPTNSTHHGLVKLKLLSSSRKPERKEKVLSPRQNYIR